MSATYRVSVGSFEGPFDLLLHLIARHKVDIHEISIAQITDDYLAVMREMDDLDLEVTTEFLLVAATLLELKAARLLPGEDDPELEELALEARDLLYARLLDYRAFKEAATYVAGRLAENAAYLPREVALEERYANLVPDVELPVSPGELAELAAGVLAARPEPVVDTSHIQPLRMSVREALVLMADELVRAGGTATFRELAAGCRHRSELVVCFLALLELYKYDQVDLQQTHHLGDVTVTANPDAVAVGDVLAEVETYEVRHAD